MGRVEQRKKKTIVNHGIPERDYYRNIPHIFDKPRHSVKAIKWTKLPFSSHSWSLQWPTILLPQVILQGVVSCFDFARCHQDLRTLNWVLWEWASRRERLRFINNTRFSFVSSSPSSAIPAWEWIDFFTPSTRNGRPEWWCCWDLPAQKWRRAWPKWCPTGTLSRWDFT